MSKQLQIRNSTAEFLIFQAEDKAQGVQVFYKDETIWATQKAMATLFDCSTDNIGVHLKNIFESGELQQEATTEKISVVQTEGDRQVTRQVQFYKLDAIILEASDDRILTDAGAVSAEQAKEYAETEFEKYRIIQDRLFESDFDKFTLPTLPFDEQE